MNTGNYTKASEVTVSAAQAIRMSNDPDLIVIMAIPDASEDMVAVTYWSKHNGMLPPWINFHKAA